ncbi:MAG: signal peptidase I [Pseudomonadota bacterium]
MSGDGTGAEPVEPATLADKVKRELKEWGQTLAVFVPAFFAFSLVLFEQRVIPSESMVPNLQVSDRVAVSKYAYGYGKYSVPWGVHRILPLGEGRLFAKTPEHGDVAVFMHPHWKRVMIKRVIGLPGDRVQMRDERLYLNGEPVETDFVRRVRYITHAEQKPVTAVETRETIGENSWLSHQWPDRTSLDNTPEFIVPEGHIFFVGDNRDNSKDARDTSGHCRAEGGVVDEAGCDPRVPAQEASVGFVPMDHLIGRAETVIFSFYRCRASDEADCPGPRLWKGL